MIEKDFINVTKNMNIDLFVNRIHCYSPLTSENLIKMSNTVTEVSSDILPDEKLDCVVYGCTSGTIAAGYDSIKKKIELAKPEAKVTTPSTAASNALKKLNISKVAIFTPYSKELNDEVVDYFKKENFIITSNYILIFQLIVILLKLIQIIYLMLFRIWNWKELKQFFFLAQIYQHYQLLINLKKN